MRKSLHFKQPKPITAYMLGGLLLVIGISMLITNRLEWTQAAILSVFVITLLGYSISYEISSDFMNSKHFKLLGLTLWKSKMSIAFPDYVTVFAARFKVGAEWGPVSAMGKERNSEGIVIRMFTGNKHFTVFRTKSLQLAKEKAIALAELLQVEITFKA